MSAFDQPCSLYRCGCPIVGPAHGAPQSLRGGVDLHCHVLAPEVEALLSARPEHQAIQAASLQQLGAESATHNLTMMQTLAPKLLDIPTRLADMDALGVDIQVLSPSPTQYHYWLDAETAEQICLMQNDRLASICDAHKGRFLALGAIAMQHPTIAVHQLKALMARGFKGVEISTNIAGRDFSDPAFEPFWRAAAELGAVVFIHPMGSTLGSRLAPYYLSNIIGQPLETTIALSHLIFSGVMDRNPDLKICAAHGGGYFPAYFGRADHAHGVRPESQRCERKPSAYLQRMWFDTVVHDPAILSHLLQTVGASQIVLGTDYPFDMGEYRLGALLDSTPGLGAAERQAIVSENALRLLRL